MNSVALMYVGLAAVSVLLPAAVVLFLHDNNIRPVARLLAVYRGMPLMGKVVGVAFAVHLIVFGSGKDGPDSTNSMLRVARPLRDASFESGFSEEEISVGYALWRVGTNETWSSSAPDGATDVAQWRKRGAADDWSHVESDGIPIAEEDDMAYMTSSGDIAVGDLTISSFTVRASIVPGGNLSAVPDAGGGSGAWHLVDGFGDFACGWVNLMLGRSTNMLASAAVEMSRGGDVAIRYDLSRAGDAAAGCAASLSRCGREVSAGLSSNVTSVVFYRLRPEDLLLPDRDCDGLSTWEEVNVYHSDPGLADSDGDGIPDGEEVLNGTDPLFRNVPDAMILARVAASSTNEAFLAFESMSENSLEASKLWDGFAADIDTVETNLLYERTISIDTCGGWRHFFLSSRPDCTGDWDLRGMTLEWEDDEGASGSAAVSPVGDSLYLPVSDGAGSVTIRLRANGQSVRSPCPVYLLAYAPVMNLSGCVSVSDPVTSNELAVVAMRDAEHPIRVTFDRSARPSSSALHEEESSLPGLADIESRSGGRLRFSGDAYGGTLEILRTGECFIPATWPGCGQSDTNSTDGAIWRKMVLLDPSIDFGSSEEYSRSYLVYDPHGDTYSVTNSYPVDGRCLWRNWMKGVDGSVSGAGEPSVTSGADDLPYVDTQCDAEGDSATGSVAVYGQVVWTETAVRSWLGLWDDGIATSAELLEELGECNPCEEDCSDGTCDAVDGASLGSVRFRVSLGSPRLGQHSGFVFFESDAPVAVTPSAFRLAVRSGASVTASTNASGIVYSCLDERGRDLTIESVANGARVIARTHETGALEYTWELTNVDGNPAQVRVRQISRIGNVMRDETYACDDGEWTSTDNITGVRESVSRVGGLGDSEGGRITETRTTQDAEGNVVCLAVTESERIGIGVNAVLRQTYRSESTGFATRWRRAEYWDDAAHRARHGKVRLLYGNSIAWSYHDYDENGFETLRVEQRNGSPRPQAFPRLVAGELIGTEGIADAWITVFDYAPAAGDDCAPEDAGRCRRETRYVVHSGLPLCIGRRWHRYTHVAHGGLPRLKRETWRASGPSAERGDAGNAYSWETTLSETAQGVPLVLRGRTASLFDENGVLEIHVFETQGGCVTDSTHREYDGTPFATYGVTEMDATHGNVLRTATCIEGNGAVVEETVSTYDEKNRLRSSAFLDGTSLTNAYSCCRLLWSEDRRGRRTLRSAVTGEDRLYYAEEDVWLRGLSTNGAHRVTQHFMDGFGRETNVVVYVAETAGEATNRTASAGRVESQSTTAYPYGGSDYVETVDERGLRTVTWTTEHADRTESVERTYEGSSSDWSLERVTTRLRGGCTVAERRWDDKWVREYSAAGYSPTGCAVRYDVTESSDCGVVTNRIVRSDFLGRTVLVETPAGDTATTYLGSSGRVDATVFSAGDVSRTTSAVYDARGERVGGTSDGMTTRKDVAYVDEGTGVWWRVERKAMIGSVTNSVAETRTQLTGLGVGSVVSRVVSISPDGAVSEAVESFGAVPGERVTVESNSLAGASVRRSQFGVTTETSGNGGAHLLSYDAFGRNVAVSRQNGLRERAYEYDSSGGLVAAHSYTNADSIVTERYGYDSFGRKTIVVDALGGAVTTRYDVVGNVLERSGAVQPARYTYDTAGRRTSLSTTRDGIIWDVTRWSYDPETGACTAKRYADGSLSSYSRAADGSVVRETNASGTWQSFVHDSAGRLAGVSTGEGGWSASFEHDEFGRVSSASNDVAFCAYARHSGGVATNEFMSVGTNTAVYVRAVDGFGRVSGRGFDGGSWQTIEYDAGGRVSRVSNDVASVAYSYSEDGWDEGWTTVLYGGVSVRRQVVRDVFRPELVVAVTNFVNGLAVDGYSYSWDAAGRIVGRNDSVFVRDEAGRITSAGPLGYSYDQAGNFLSLACGTNVLPCAANGLNQCMSFAGDDVVFDADGCVASFDGISFGYDSTLRLSSASDLGGQRAVFSYDAFGRRAKRESASGTSAFFYDGLALVREVRSDGDGIVGVDEYCWGRDESGTLGGAGGVGGLVCIVHDGAAYVPLYDALGNITAYVDSTGDVVARYSYGAFGNVVSSAGAQASEFRFGFSTKYMDDATGLLLYEYRCYSPALGRWMTRDPLGEDGGENLYAFCGNDPVGKYDALGLSTEVPLILPDPRNLWKAFSVLYFRATMNWYFSATLLEMSIDGTRRTSPEVFPDGSAEASRILASEDYRREVRRIIRSLPAGMNRVEESGVVEFTSGDLYAAAHRADIVFDGYVCRPIIGADRVALNVTVSDTYDFEWWGLSDARRNNSLPVGILIMVGNNLAYLDQCVGYIRPFRWEAHFKDSGRYTR